MTFTIGSRTGAELLAFQATASGCGLCGGAGSLPDPEHPLARLPCPRCGEPPRRRSRAGAIAADEASNALGDFLWHGLIWSSCASIGLLSLVMLVALAKGIFG